MQDVLIQEKTLIKKCLSRILIWIFKAMRCSHTFLSEEWYVFSKSRAIFWFSLYLIRLMQRKANQPQLLKDQVAMVLHHMTTVRLDLNLRPFAPTHGSLHLHQGPADTLRPTSLFSFLTIDQTSDFSSCLPPVTRSSFHQPPGWWQSEFSNKLYYFVLFTNINTGDHYPFDNIFLSFRYLFLSSVTFSLHFSF